MNRYFEAILVANELHTYTQISEFASSFCQLFTDSFLSTVYLIRVPGPLNAIRECPFLSSG